MRALLLLIILGLGWYIFGGNAGTHSSSAADAPDFTPSAEASQQPIQNNLPGTQKIPFSDGNLRLLAEFEVTARILGRENYSLDKESQYSPLDLALGWGPMANPRVIEKLKITQGGRFYHYRWSNAPPLPGKQIAHNSANMHIIPANANVKKSLDQLERGQMVSLKGYLVHYREDIGKRWWEWKSSLTRTDEGKGACELFYVENVVAH